MICSPHSGEAQEDVLHDGGRDPREKVVLQDYGADCVAVIGHEVARDDTWRREADCADAILVSRLNANLDREATEIQDEETDNRTRQF